ncbi:MAG: accessory gene regulator B family protein [Defluviitaleaceae bacterium]|nr:accessory gene regulator B family protein [Defluviitaleaceae bacterium]
MIHKLANKIASIFVSYGESSEENADIYAYAVEAILALIVNLTVCLIIALIFGRVLEGIVFIFGFAILRRYAGGFHARTHLICIITFACIVFSAMVLISILINFGNLAPLIISTIAFIGIFTATVLERKLMSPSEAEHCKLRKNGTWIITAIWLISVIDLYLFNSNIGLTLSLSLLSVFGSMAFAIYIFVLVPRRKEVQ